MKTYLVFIFFLFSNMIIHAQENFEGKIVYKSDATGTEKKDITAEVFLKGHKILLIAVDKKDSTVNARCLYDFQKGIFYTFSFNDSTILTSSLGHDISLKKISDVMDTTNSLITVNGYTAKKVLYQVDGPSDSHFKKLEAWFCEELVFKVPDSIKSLSPPFAIFNGNSISLKMKLIMEDTAPAGPITISIYASSISKTPLNDSLFEIPSYFKIKDRDEYMNDLMRKFKEIDSDLKNTAPLPTNPEGNKPH